VAWFALANIITLFAALSSKRLINISKKYIQFKHISMASEKDYTLVFCRRINENGDKEILLGMKKRGFGVGRWNGFGGKVENGESIEEAALRELNEESSLVASALSRKGYIVFNMKETNKIMKVKI
jgi:8-oxo-dGTP diphosphatase/2-hydroxy-dATP diphosphatase